MSTKYVSRIYPYRGMVVVSRRLDVDGDGWRSFFCKPHSYSPTPSSIRRLIKLCEYNMSVSYAIKIAFRDLIGGTNV